MSAGDLTPTQVDDLKRAVHNAEKASGLKFSTYVGETEGDPRDHARDLLNKLDDPARSVLVLCDPVNRALEIVTGSEARRWLDDGECRLAAATMESNFEAGDIAGGLVNGIQQLGGAARHPELLHVSHL
ncbi:DUF5130 family protein [Mariniluteicoccus flavus]